MRFVFNTGMKQIDLKDALSSSVMTLNTCRLSICDILVPTERRIGRERSGNILRRKKTKPVDFPSSKR